MTEEREVVVVGGGPAGCAAALFLKQRGHDVLLVDAARFPRDKVCGEGFSPEAWRLLEAAGAAAAVRALRPHAIRGMTLTAPDGTCFSGDYGDDREPGFAARRADLDLALLGATRAAGVEVREATRGQDVVVRDGVITGVMLDGPRGDAPCASRVLIAADGRTSRVARRLGLLREHRRLRKFAVRGHWEGVAALTDHGEMHVGGGGYCGIAPLSSTAANVAFVLDHREMASAGGDLESFYRAVLERWPRVAERLAHARLVGLPRAVGPLAIVARQVSAPGALLVGDAAGFYDPFTGEGLTLALRSAELAAGVVSRALRRGRTHDLGEYDRLRDAATRHKFRLNRLLQAVVEVPALSNAVAARLSRRPDLADQLVGIAGDFIPARTALGPRFLCALMTA